MAKSGLKLVSKAPWVAGRSWTSVAGTVVGGAVEESVLEVGRAAGLVVASGAGATATVA
jgi:hypothetical protein